MAIDALNLDCRPHLAVELGVAVVVLVEVAVDAVHPFLQMDVHQVHRHVVVPARALGEGFAGGGNWQRLIRLDDGGLELLGGDTRDFLA